MSPHVWLRFNKCFYFICLSFCTQFIGYANVHARLSLEGFASGTPDDLALAFTMICLV